MQFTEGTGGNVVDRLRVAAARYTSLPARTVKKKEVAWPKLIGHIPQRVDERGSEASRVMCTK